MGVTGIEAEHVTMALTGAVPRTEVQLLVYRAPAATPNPTIEQLNTLGYNHICFAVEDLDAEVRGLAASGIETRTKVLDFHGRKLVFLRGPEGITVELSERYQSGKVASGTTTPWPGPAWYTARNIPPGTPEPRLRGEDRRPECACS